MLTTLLKGEFERPCYEVMLVCRTLWTAAVEASKQFLTVEKAMGECTTQMEALGEVMNAIPTVTAATLPDLIKKILGCSRAVDAMNIARNSDDPNGPAKSDLLKAELGKLWDLLAKDQEAVTANFKNEVSNLWMTGEQTVALQPEAVQHFVKAALHGCLAY